MNEFNQTSCCLVDNWSLECAASLLEEGIEQIRRDIMTDYLNDISQSMLAGVSVTPENYRTYVNDDSIFFGALSNILNAIVLFDDVIYVRNGFEFAWQRFSTFYSETNDVLKGVDYSKLDKSATVKDYNSSNFGVPFYCYLAKAFGCDLLVNPLRAEQLIKEAMTKNITYGELAFDLLESLDKSLKEKTDDLKSRVLTQNIIKNLSLPSLTNLVLSEAATSSEILTVARQMKHSSKVVDFRNTLKECLHDLKASTNYSTMLNNAASAIESAISKVQHKKEVGSIGINILFISLSYNINKWFQKENYTIFLRDIAKCRLELDGNNSHVQRLFHNGS